MDFETEYRSRIIRLEQKVDFLLRELNLEAKELENRYRPQAEDVLALVRQGDKIRAIKLYMERTGVSFREAKRIVDQM